MEAAVAAKDWKTLFSLLRMADEYDMAMFWEKYPYGALPEFDKYSIDRYGKWEMFYNWVKFLKERDEKTNFL